MRTADGSDRVLTAHKWFGFELLAPYIGMTGRLLVALFTMFDY